MSIDNSDFENPKSTNDQFEEMSDKIDMLKELANKYDQLQKTPIKRVNTTLKNYGFLSPLTDSGLKRVTKLNLRLNKSPIKSISLQRKKLYAQSYSQDSIERLKQNSKSSDNQADCDLDAISAFKIPVDIDDEKRDNQISSNGDSDEKSNMNYFNVIKLKEIYDKDEGLLRRLPRSVSLDKMFRNTEPSSMLMCTMESSTVSLKISCRDDSEIQKSMDNDSQEENVAYSKDSSVLNLTDDKDDRDILMRIKLAQRDVKFAANYLQIVLDNEETIRGWVFHVNACKSFVEAKIRMNTVTTEMAFVNDESSSLIVGDLEIECFELEIKPGLFIVDYMNKNIFINWNHIQSIQHLFVCVYIGDHESIFTSNIISLMDENDVDTCKLRKRPASKLEIFKQLILQNIQPDSKIVFDVFSMTVHPFKHCIKHPLINRFISRHNSLEHLRSKLMTVSKKCKKIKNNKTRSESTMFTNIMTFQMSSGIKESSVTNTEKSNVTKNCVLTGLVSFQTKMYKKLKKTIEGVLNVWFNGSWKHYFCKLNPDSIVGEPSMFSSLDNKPTKRVLIPLFVCTSLTMDCPAWICTKPNAFSIEIADNTADFDHPNMIIPICEQNCEDGMTKKLFVFEANNEEEKNNWCRAIDEVLKTFHIIDN